MKKNIIYVLLYVWPIFDLEYVSSKYALEYLAGKNEAKIKKKYKCEKNVSTYQIAGR